MLFIDTSAFVSRSTPLVAVDAELPFIQATPKRLLLPDQQLSYKRHVLELFSEQQDLVNKGLPAPVILEEDILSLVSLECGEKLEVVQVPAVQQVPASAEEDRNPFRVLARMENGIMLAPAAHKCSKNPFLSSGRNNIAGIRAPNPSRPFGDGKENAPAQGRARNPFRADQGNAVQQVRMNNPFRDLSGKAPYRAISLSAPVVVPEPPKLSLANFDFHEQLGRGGQGSVYLVKPKASNSRFALKIILKNGPNTDEKSVLLEKKILESNRESGGCLVDLVGAFHDFAAFYFIMPFCEGGDLDTLLWGQPGHRFPLDIAQFYAAEIVWGMLALHRAKYLHRDLKLLNVFIKQDGHIAIGDFGLAAPFEADHTPVEAGTWCGTLSHMAPETWQGKGWTTAADWWSVGVMLYHMLHGEMPWDPDYESTDYEAMSKAVCDTEPTYACDLDPTAQRLLEGLLRKNPTARLGFYHVAMEPFFTPTPWTSVASGTLSPPFLPRVENEMTTSLAPEDIPADAARYTFLDPHPHFEFISPELEEAMVRASSTSVPLSTVTGDDTSCKLTVSRSSSRTVVHPEQITATPTGSTDTFCSSDIKQTKNMTKSVSGSVGTCTLSIVDEDLITKGPDRQEPLTVEIDAGQASSLAHRKCWIQHRWTKLQDGVRRAFRWQRSRC